MRVRAPGCALLTIAAITLGAATVHAGWQPNGAPVCFHPDYQSGPTMASDGRGGTFVMWADDRDPGATENDLFFQHITSAGDPAPGWPAGGLPMCTAPGRQSRTFGSLTPDGEGGVLATWWDRRNGVSDDIYVQRMTPSGDPAPGWPVNGVRVTDLPWTESWSAVASDGAGGAFVAWQDTRDYLYPTNQSDLYAMHLLADGTPAPGWPENGRPLATGPKSEGDPFLMADGAGGVLIVWLYGDLSANEIRGVRLTADGEVAPGWIAGGKVLCSPPRIRGNLTWVSDGAGGAYLAWDDYRTSPPGTPVPDLSDYSDIYALRITGTGDISPGWPSDGLALCVLPGIQQDVHLAADGLGGCLVAWEDYRNYFPSNYSDVYALRVQGDGTLAPGWTPQGTLASTGLGFQLTPQVAADGAGGAYLFYNDYAGEGYKLAVQHLGGNGQLAPGWPAQGLRLVEGPGEQQYQQAMTDGLGGAITVWSDRRYNALGEWEYDIYAQRVGVDGPTPVLVSLAGVEAEAGLVRLTWYAAGGATLGADVERRTETNTWAPLGSITSDGGGTLRYEDRTVVPGTRYAYRLAYRDGAEAAHTAETWVTVPPLRFALRGLTPNPSAGDPVVSLSLASDAPAVIELFDLHGRLVLSHEVGAPGPGAHSVRLEGRGRLPAGVYTVRLRQGPSLATARAVIVR